MVGGLAGDIGVLAVGQVDPLHEPDRLEDLQRAEHRRTADLPVTVRIGQTADSVLVSVADNGLGIPPENLPKIFTQGFTTRKGGHGFGLHSSILAAQELGGSLEVQSAGLGHGAVFTIKIPVTTNPILIHPDSNGVGHNELPARDN